jgi:ketosteroid isomerase-like protein
VLAGVDRFWDAYAHQDLAALERLYAEEAVQIGAQRLEGREAILRYLRGYYKGLQIQGWSHTQNSVRLSGNLALVSYWGEETGLADGDAYRVAGWVSEVWIRRDGAWLNLQSHFGANQAPAAEESAP